MDIRVEKYAVQRRMNRFLKTVLEGGGYTVLNDMSSKTALE